MRKARFLHAIAAIALMSAMPAMAGETTETNLLDQLPPTPDIEIPEGQSFLDATFWPVAAYDVDAGNFDAGLRVTFDLMDNLRVRTDLLSRGGFEEFDFSDASTTLSLRYDLIERNNLYTYLVAGIGSDGLDRFNMAYTFGAGIEYEFNQGSAVFLEYQNNRSDSDEFDSDRSLILAGVSFSLDNIPFLNGFDLPFLNKRE